MDQQKTGEFLKQLRREKGLTQEQLAEKFYVSSRSVSRWENGSNMPDLATLIELADFYDADIREIIDGERKSENMDTETKDTLKKVAQDTQEQHNKDTKKMIEIMVTSVVLILFCLILSDTNGFGGRITNYQSLVFFTNGLTLAALGLNILYLTGFFDKLTQWKLRRKENKE